MKTLHFLKLLHQKLQIGDNRSIYLNAQPGRLLARLDIDQLSLVDDTFVDVLFQQLLQRETWHTALQFPPGYRKEAALQKLAHRLEALHIENKNQQQERGIAPLALGFPILLLRDPDVPQRLLRAPLFLWSIQIHKNIQQDGRWDFMRDTQDTVRLNPLLRAYVQKTYGIHWETLEEHQVLTAAQIAAYCAGYLRQIYPSIPSQEVDYLESRFQHGIQAFPEAQELIQRPVEQPAFLWSAVFGLFKTPKQSIIQDIEALIEQPVLQKKTFNPPVLKASYTHSFASLPTDPSQQRLLQLLTEGKNLVIQGPPGTGKSQTLTAILTNALAHGKCCLVVCEKKTALDILYQNLKGLGLSELAVVIEDIHRDRAQVVESVRKRIDETETYFEHSAQYKQLLQSCSKNLAQLEAFHKKLAAPILGDKSWTSVVGLCIDAATQEAHAQLNNYLSPTDYTFDSKELLKIQHHLKEAEPLCAPFKRFAHPFNALAHTHFTQANVHQVQTIIEHKLQHMLQAIEGAQRDILAYLFEYETLLEDHFTTFYSDQRHLIKSLITSLEETIQFKNRFLARKNKGVGQQLLKGLSLFSTKHKDVLQNKKHIEKYYAELTHRHNTYNYFPTQFSDIEATTAVYETLLKEIKSYDDALDSWFAETENTVRRSVHQLSINNVHAHIDFSEKVEVLHYELEQLFQKIAQSTLLRVGLSFEVKAIRLYQIELEAFYNNLKEIQDCMPEFRDYHALKYYWLSLPSASKAAVRGLLEAQCKDWPTQFAGWYYHWLLSAKEDRALPFEKNFEHIISTLNTEMDALYQAQITHSIKYWQHAQQQATAAFHKHRAPIRIQNLYNKKSSRGQRAHALRKIISTDTHLFTRYFPIVLVSPTVATSILPLKQDIFDLVLFDEASQIRVEETYSLLLRGKQIVISGDRHQMPPSSYFRSTLPLETVVESHEKEEELLLETQTYLADSESLLEYVEHSGDYHHAYLELHYRSAHPHLIDFSNVAFYGGRLQAMPLRTPYTPISLYNIDGIYTKSINDAEAQAILQWLKDFTCYETQRIGIVTLNLYQRNYIITCLQDAASKDKAFAHKYTALLQHGLFIKTLEHVQGDERDILLISTTFGLREDGSFIQNYGLLNQQKGYRLLNVLITRAKRQIHIFTSIPTNIYRNYTQAFEKQGLKGKAILYAYLSYAESVSQHEEARRQLILKQIKAYAPEHIASSLPQQTHQASLQAHIIAFINEILPALNVQAPYQLAGFLVDIMIFDENDKPLAVLELDAYSKHESPVANLWDLYLPAQLKHFGIQYIRVWSYSWWATPSQAKAQLRESLTTHINQTKQS